MRFNPEETKKRLSDIKEVHSQLKDLLKAIDMECKRFNPDQEVISETIQVCSRLSSKLQSLQRFTKRIR